MQVLYPCCCGLDIHKKFVVACVLRTALDGSVQKETRTFSTMTTELLALGDWLRALRCTHVAMESTSSYWRPVYNLLEGQFELLVANAYHIKTVPGRKTDVKDAEWIADLLRHGLLRGSFIPAPEQRHLRDLTRYRTHLVEERARVTNRLQAVLEDANIKLAAVVTDVRGVSARAILDALVAGESDPVLLAELARGRLRAKRDQLAQAVVGRFAPHHAFMITEQLSHLDYLDEAMERISTEIEQRLQEEWEAVELLDSVPGISQRAAEIVVAELGIDLGRFRSAKHLASWAGMCPGNKESGGKRLSGKTRKGNVWLRQVLIEIAHVASKTKDTYLAAQYRRIAARRGKKRALIALGHTLLVIIYHILTERKPYHELGGTYFDQREREQVERRLIRRLERLGYSVSLQPADSSPQSAA
jgi:transposase